MCICIIQNIVVASDSYSILNVLKAFAAHVVCHNLVFVAQAKL